MDIENKQDHSVSVEKKISSFVATTEMMLELAKQSEWEQLAEMESKRRPELETFFNSLNPNDLQANSELLRVSIGRILTLDNQIIALSAESKNRIAELMQQSNSTRQAMSEYQKKYGAIAFLKIALYSITT